MTDAIMADVRRCVLLLGPLDHISPRGLGAVDGGPEEPRVGKRIAERGAYGIRRGCCGRRVPRGRPQ